MKSALRRALGIADEIDSFKWTGSPGDAPDGIYFSIQHLRELAFRLRAAAQSLDHPRLWDALKNLPEDVDGDDFQAGVAFHAQLLGIAGWLRDAVEEWGDDPSQWRIDRAALKSNVAQLDTPSLNTKERESLLKLVIGMAVGGYGYNRSSAKSGVPQEIANDLALNGLRLDVDTVRKYLQQGSVLLPLEPNSDQG
jgi:hypothetical protein